MTTIQKTQIYQQHVWFGGDVGHEPLAQHRRFRSNDLDCAREMVARKYCAHQLDIIGVDGVLDSVHNHFAMPDISFNYMRYGRTVSINPGELKDFYLIQIPLNGHAEIRNGHQQVQSGAGVGTILNPDLATQMVWHADCEMLLVQISKQRVKSVAETYLDRQLSAPIRFDSKLRMHATQLIALRAQLREMFQSVDYGWAPDNLTNFLTELLIVQPSNVQCFLDAHPGTIVHRQIAKSIEYIKANFREEIDLADIADAAAASPRALQYGFKRAYGLTPMQMLRLERLRWARHLLLAADRKKKITEIAMDLGFQHLGRFSQDYREAFGETPLQTIKRINGLDH